MESGRGKGGVRSRGLYGLFRYVFLKGYGVLAVLVTDRVSVLAILVANRGGFCALVLNCVCFLEGTTLHILINKTINKTLFIVPLTSA